MFDNVANNFNYNINAVSGTLRKSHPKSKMSIRELSNARYVYDYEKPRLFEYNDTEIIVLQVMFVGENKVIIEYVNKKDFEEENK